MATSGWISVAAACLLFGSFGVPIKDKTVREAKVHPLVFQSYKTGWTLLTSTAAALVLSPSHTLTFSWWGVVSGLAWVPAGIAAIVSVQHCGLGLGQSIWSTAIVLVSFFWGVVVFDEPLDSPGLAILSIGALCTGIVGMTIASSYSSTIPYSPIDQASSAVEMLETPHNTSRIAGLSITHQQIGIAAALFNGFWGGSNLVPLKLAGKSAGKEFVFSFAAGSALVNVGIWICLFVWRRCIRKCCGAGALAMPGLAWREMAIPGMLCGCLWSAGNIAAIYAVSTLGQSVGYPSVQGSMIVSGLWSLVYFREITGRWAYLWFGFAVIAFSGVLGLCFARSS